MECYLPLLEILEAAERDPKQNPKVTIGLSPTLLSLLNDKDLKRRFPKWLSIRLELLKSAPNEHKNAAEHLTKRIELQLDHWQKGQDDLIHRFANLQNLGVLDLLTCAATHGYLPLLRENPEAIRGQLNTAVREHERLIGVPPIGIWLPECAYYEGLDVLILEAGLKYAVLDAHGILHGNPRPKYGIYAPICTKNRVAFFGRDSDSTLPVWSAKDGYPGNPYYREFHRDLGWDLPIKDLEGLGLNEPRPLGLKLHRVTDPRTALQNKKPYEPELANKLVRKHAKHYLKGRKLQLESLASTTGIIPSVVAPFDAELFGHWWYEGPAFLSELFSQSEEHQVTFTRLRDLLSNTPNLQVCDPSPSSWGQGGYHDYWLNESNAWVVTEWSKAGLAMQRNIENLGHEKSKSRLFKQAARELLLAQSSDWSFILRAGTTTSLAKERIHRHLERFWRLIEIIEGHKTFSEEYLGQLEKEDNIFPMIQIKDWSPLKV